MTVPARVNGSKPKATTSRGKAPLKRFVVLEVIQTVEAESEAEARERLPKGRVFQVVEVMS